VTYGALTLARLGLEVRALVGADAQAAEATELDLLCRAGAEVSIARLRRGPVFVNEEHPGGRIQLAIEVSHGLPVESLPAGWAASADAVLLAPVAAELGPEWAGVGRPDAVVALGWQGLLRTLAAGAPVERRAPGPSALLRRAGLVGLSRTDVALDASLAHLAALVNPEATLVVTDAERGGLIAEPARTHAVRRWRPYRAIVADRVVDPTGAGDVFLATLLACRLDAVRLGVRGDGPGTLQLAAAAASLSVEAAGLDGVAALDAVLARAARPPAGPATT
jgi:pfkB family carbohydrate kinase